MSTAVTKYLDSKKLSFRLDGRNAILACPVCGQDENQFGINIDNWFYQCFRGKCAAKGNETTFKRLFGDSVERKSNLEDEDVVVSQVAVGVKKKEQLPDINAAHMLLLENDAVLNWLNDDRGFTIDIVKQFKLGMGKRKFSDGKISQALMFPYFAKGVCVGVKYKSIPPDPKDFRFSAGWDLGLYNEDVIVKDMESLIICEGETDTLALIAQGYTNVVGVSGCETKKVSYDTLLELPKKIYLVMDNDVAGQKGARTFAERFGIDKFHIVHIPPDPIESGKNIKDVNDFFLAGKTKEDFDRLLEQARPYDVEGVTTMDEAFDKIIYQLEHGGSLLPEFQFKWPSVTKRAKGIDRKDLIVLLAAAKTGKTTMCLNQAEFMAANYGLNIHFDCMEMEDYQLVKKWTAMVLEVDEDSLTREQINQGRQIAQSRNNGISFSRSRPESLEQYVDMVRKWKRRYNIDVFVFDNFQILVDLTIAKSGTRSRPDYMSRVSKTLKALMAELNSVGILISQPKQLQEGIMVGVNDSEGSSTLTKDADLFLTANRNTELKMKLAQADAIGKLETDKSHSENIYVEIGLSRRSPGGICTLKIDGAKSLIREYTDDERKATSKKAIMNGIEVVDETAHETETVEI